MRAPILAAVLLAAVPAYADEAAPPSAGVSAAPSAATAAPATVSSPSVVADAGSPSRDQLVNAYPERLADRPRAIGTGLFEAGFQGGYQFNGAQGFGEVPTLRYGLTDALELTLLGARYVIAEDGRNYPGLAIRAQIHDLAYQAQSGTNYNYPLLRPGVFAEFRDRLPFHLSFNGLLGYAVSFQAARGADGSQLPNSQRISDARVPLLIEAQWSPLSMVSLSVSADYLDDALDVANDGGGVNHSDAQVSVAVTYNSSRFDLRVFYTSNWFADARLGFVPELGASAAVRL